MRILFFMLAWAAPAGIAGILGWKGIWGTGSAFFDYLIPFPVAGGIMHVPSFFAAAAAIVAIDKAPAAISRFIPTLGMLVFAGALAMQIDFGRLGAWLFTDYRPYGSPLRLNSNALLLFVTTDAFAVWLYGLLKGLAPPRQAWIALPVVVAAVAGVNVALYRFSGPEFTIGGSQAGTSRGREITLVHTTAPFNEDTFSTWLESNQSLTRPWQSPNMEHVAIIFTSSMQAIKWRQFDNIDSDATVATICLYEEDHSTFVHAGYHDCFAERRTVDEKLTEIVSRQKTGFGKDIDYWHARLQLCRNVTLPEDTFTDVKLLDTCQSLIRSHPTFMARLVDRYGAQSEEVLFVRNEAARFSLGETGYEHRSP